jgi:hypothetical protein
MHVPTSRARRPRAHLIHIGKTGGTALKSALAPVVHDGDYEIVLHGHGTRLKHVPVGEKVFFVIRDPVDRYVSGFNSRLRHGRPRYDIPWTPEEQLAFEQFTSADRLAVALSSEDSSERARAFQAMTSIGHVRASYWQWFHHRYLVQKRLDDLLLVMWFPDLSTVFGQLRDLLGLPDDLCLPDDEVGSHRSPDTADRALSSLARSNLERWYGADVAFVEFCSGLSCFAGPSHPQAQQAGQIQAECTPPQSPEPGLSGLSECQMTRAVGSAAEPLALPVDRASGA